MSRLVGEAWRARLAPDHVAELCEGWYRDALGEIGPSGSSPSPTTILALPATPRVRLSRGLAEGAAARGHEVEVVAPHAPGTATRGASLAESRLHRFRYASGVVRAGGLHRRPPSGNPVRPRWPRWPFPGFSWPSGTRCAAALRASGLTSIHAHWWFPGGWFASRHRSAVPDNLSRVGRATAGAGAWSEHSSASVPRNGRHGSPRSRTFWPRISNVAARDSRPSRW